MSIYLKIPNIKGSANAKGYENWISLITLSNGLIRHIKSTIGQMHDREVSVPHFSEIVVTKNMDCASPQLFQQSCQGKTISQAEIHVCDSQGAFLKYKIYDAIISNRQVTVSSGSQPIESLSLNFSKIEETYIPRNSEHQVMSPFTSGYDLKEAAVV